MDTTTIAAISGMVGTILPLLIAAILRCKYPEPVRAILAFLVCVAAGFVTSLVTGTWSWTHLGVSIASVTGAAWLTFNNFWNKIGATDKIESMSSKLTGG